MSSKADGGKRKHRSIFWKIILGAIILVIAIRIALPYVLLDQVNKRLKEMPQYYGHVDDLSLSIIRGAYQIHDIYLDRQDSVTRVRTPFVAADNVDISLEWRALFKGRIVGELEIDRPIVRFTKDEVEPEEVAQDTVELADLLDDLMPIELNRLRLNNGSFQFRDPTTSPEVFLAMENIRLLAENLSTVENEDELLPASVSMFANVYGGTFDLDMELDPIASSPTFDMAAEVTGTDLTLFNEFFQAYGNFDIERGTFGMFTEVAAKDGKFLGYVKPVIEDLKVLGPKDREKDLGEQIWQGIVGLGSMLIKNPQEKQIATRIPLEGDLNEPDVRTWYAVIDLLRNAFIEALEPQLDQDVSIERVPEGFEEDDRGFFQRLFGGQGPNKEEREGRRRARREARDR